MGIESIAIFLNNKNIFYGGETITGFCQVVVSENTDIPNFVVRFNGTARVHWSETRTRTRHSNGRSHTEHYTVHYSAYHNIITMQQDILVQNGYLPPGNHSLPFGFQLPPNLVTSFEAMHAYIRYSLEAKVPQSWFKSLFSPKKAYVTVKIVQPIDTNLPQYAFPVKATDTKTICCCCCAQGPLVVEAASDRAAYCPNEAVSVTATFDNSSNRTVRPYIKLVQRVNMNAHGRHKSSSRSWSLGTLGPADGLLNEMAAGGKTVWNGTQFAIPPVSPSISLPILQVSYFLEVGLDIPMAFDLEVYLPVIIGTIPYRGPRPVVNQPGGQHFAPWRGLARQASRHAPEPSAPPIELAGEGFRATEPPPSYFETVLGEAPTLPMEDNDQDESGASAPPQFGSAPNQPPPIGFVGQKY